VRDDRIARRGRSLTVAGARRPGRSEVRSAVAHVCAVLGCHDAVTGIYLARVASVLVEFRICDFHYLLGQAGMPPVIVDDPEGQVQVLVWDQ
jgi:hypothetical protein